MNTSPRLRKRVWLPVLALVALGLALGVSIVRSNISRIVVYNQTGERLLGLKIVACGQTKVLPPMEEDTSYRWKLAAEGEASMIELEQPTEPPWTWQGAFIEPSGGHRVILRLWPDGEVEVHAQINFWRRLLTGAPAGQD